MHADRPEGGGPCEAEYTTRRNITSGVSSKWRARKACGHARESGKVGDIQERGRGSAVTGAGRRRGKHSVVKYSNGRSNRKKEEGKRAAEAG